MPSLIYCAMLASKLVVIIEVYVVYQYPYLLQHMPKALSVQLYPIEAPQVPSGLVVDSDGKSGLEQMPNSF
jgi:hypothetical protein